MSIPISTVVNVQVAIPPTIPAGTGFSTLMVLGKSTSLPLGSRAQTFSSMQEVGSVFSATSEEYQAAETFFSQNPRPVFMVIGRAVTGAVSGELLGSSNYESDLSKWHNISAGDALYLTIDGQQVMLTNMDFSQATSLNGVAAVVDSAMADPWRDTGQLSSPITDTDTTIPLRAPSKAQIGDTLQIESEYMTVMQTSDPLNLVVTRGSRGSTAVGHSVGANVTVLASGIANGSCVFNGSAFYFQSGSTGPSSTIALTQSSPPLSAMLGIESGSISSPGLTGAETVAQSLDACSAIESFYGFVLTKDFSDTDAFDAAKWSEANTKLFGHATGDANCKSPTASSGSFPAEAQQAGFTRTADAYNDPQGLSDYLMVSALARELAVDFSQPNSMITLMFKTMPSVTPSNINLADKQVLDSINCNYYASFGAAPMFATGVCASGLWIDLRHGLDYMSQHLAQAAFFGLYTAPKIPQTDKGVAYLETLCNNAMEDMVNCGFIAPGTWEGTGISGVVNTGEYLTKGYKVISATIASQSEADRQRRKAPPITIVCKASGAFHEVDIYVQFEQ